MAGKCRFSCGLIPGGKVQSKLRSADNMFHPEAFRRSSTNLWLVPGKFLVPFLFLIVRSDIVSSSTNLSCPGYPWNEVSTVCDVGASIGTFSSPLAKAHPHLKIINQDLERVIPQAKEVGVYSPIPRYASGLPEHRNGKGKLRRLCKNSGLISCL